MARAARWFGVLVVCVVCATVALDLDDVNPLVRKAEYAVRGMILDRAMQIEADLRDPARRATWPFDRVVLCNIGNPQALGQPPPAFAREVLSGVMNPALLDSGALDAAVVQRARRYLAATTGGVGAYSESKGLRLVRDEVAAFIERRDGFPADPESIFLTDGASAGVKHLATLLLKGPGDALLSPAPGYPLYGALAALSNATIAPYYLDEASGWSTSLDELERAYERSVTQLGATPRALVVINPGNPTGATLDRDALEAVVRFCQRRRLVLLADEVYQENVYAASPAPFVSFKKVVRDLKADDVALVSFHSVSKGFTGECGLRGGYLELCNVAPDVVSQLVKLASIALCSNVPGQIAVGLMVNPPNDGGAEAATYRADRDATLASLERRAQRIAAALNALPGVSCDGATGALYLFPNVELPERAVLEAHSRGLAPDAFYALNLLEHTGLVVVPGSGFGQREGTFHFRTTFLPPEGDIDGVLDRLGAFHHGFLAQFADEPADGAAAEETAPRGHEL